MLKVNNIYFKIMLSLALVVSAFLVYDFFLALFDPMPKFANLNYGLRILTYYSFFTIQTNYLVTIFFYIAAIKMRKKQQYPQFPLLLAITTYITITMLVFWGGIASKGNELNQYDGWHWVGTFFLHLINPIIMITVFCFTCGKKYYFWENHAKKNLWIILVYMFFFLITSLIKGIILHHFKYDSDILFPYFFLDIYSDTWFFLLTIALLVILAIAIGMQYFYIWLNNKLYIKRHKNKHITEWSPPNNIRLIWKFDHKVKVGIRLALSCTIIVFIITLALTSILIFSALIIGAIAAAFKSTSWPLWLVIGGVSLLIISFIILIILIPAIKYTKKGSLQAKNLIAMLMINLTIFSWFTIIGPILGIISIIKILKGTETPEEFKTN
ncbi:hypothetical protein SSYRP_v1c09490 [Spiroplasma syrphidicola EA-1]|uniref:Transmembrane protein n=1 Tax=Spiroplasma syrphidicola EA-1 TaxID=1276229 RepID=R4UMQ4_9MOLU|nr:hypothetical protein [Spiroplasma syrphidicola]AGM26536.1 hypothetical protein SSYRP_v1c09490 [Spiroplasma syrphidicola EA-1]